eukprot:CAMPEP_0176413824 /NCGR_PEP_ID=MMETSP0127-20121128/4912_1 /TAXON_ID=938130 /ORGANISM="Platyophrya macrostoma, Strain WH" /LENGTH=265 /DNA_ID=CAMNT_0017793645 /DNA_START=127 /DNA_END=924 /DNA_ORIENTATION=-
MILLNKLVIDTYHLDFPMGLLVLQNGCALLLIATLKQLRLVHYPDFDWTVVRKWLPLTVLFVGMLWTSMKSLKIMSVAVQTILKNLAIILTALGDQYLFNKHVTAPMYGAFGLMVLGSYLGSVGDKWVTSWGLFWTFSNIGFTVAYVLYMKRLLVATLPDMGSAIAASSTGALVCLFMMILVGSVMTFASFWCMKVTSPTTYSVTGALNKIPLALMGIFIFGHMPTSVGWFGIVVALSGGVWYTWLNRPAPKPKEFPIGDERRAV